MGRRGRCGQNAKLVVVVSWQGGGGRGGGTGRQTYIIQHRGQRCNFEIEQEELAAILHAAAHRARTRPLRADKGRRQQVRKPERGANGRGETRSDEFKGTVLITLRQMQEYRKRANVTRRTCRPRGNTALTRPSSRSGDRKRPWGTCEHKRRHRHARRCQGQRKNTVEEGTRPRKTKRPNLPKAEPPAGTEWEHMGTPQALSEYMCSSELGALGLDETPQVDAAGTGPKRKREKRESEGQGPNVTLRSAVARQAGGDERAQQRGETDATLPKLCVSRVQDTPQGLEVVDVGKKTALVSCRRRRTRIT